ncbi:MAG: hypothetical protein J5993_04080 [Clostridia bacterium]|nr:hypothetical protein [Clostridia bacterium]
MKGLLCKKCGKLHDFSSVSVCYRCGNYYCKDCCDEGYCPNCLDKLSLIM